MRIQQIVETTTAGSVATVAQPMMTQTRENTNVRGLKPVQQVMKGAKKKGPYANSIVESKVTEDDLAEQDLIVIPGQGRLRRTGFIKHDLDQGEHEGHTLKNSLHTIARAASELDKRLSTQSEFPEWVSEKIGAAKGMMVSVMDYLISSQEMQHDSDAMEGVAEGYPKDLSGISTDKLKAYLAKQNQKQVPGKDNQIKRVRAELRRREERNFGNIDDEEENQWWIDYDMKEGVAEGFDKEAEAYKAHLLKTAPKVMDFLSKAVKGWRPSKEEMLGAIDTGYMVMKHTGDVKQAGKAMMDELNTLHRMSQGQQGVAEGGIKDVESKIKAHDQRKADREQAGDPYVAHKLHSHNVIRKQLLDKRKRAQAGYHKKMDQQGVAEGIDAAWDAAKKKVSEGAKVDRMVKHVKQSEKKLGHSDKEAENIAWATANKRGMLDNKNKKK